MFRETASARRRRILDLGGAEPESFAFYNRIGGQICVLDTVNRLAAVQPYSLSAELPEAAQDFQFDICLFWDSLNFLDGPALRKFGMDLSTRIHRQTRVHLFAAYTPIRAFQSNRYAPLDFRNLATKPRNHLVPHAHSKRDIDKALIGLRAAHTLLRPGNRLEMLLVPS